VTVLERRDEQLLGHRRSEPRRSACLRVAELVGLRAMPASSATNRQPILRTAMT